MAEHASLYSSIHHTLSSASVCVFSAETIRDKQNSYDLMIVYMILPGGSAAAARSRAAGAPSAPTMNENPLGPDTSKRRVRSVPRRMMLESSMAVEFDKGGTEELVAGNTARN